MTGKILTSVAAALAFGTAGLAINATAAPRFGGGAAPHFSAPHFAAPHFAAPHVAAPHFAAPHFAVHHFAAPTGRAHNFVAHRSVGEAHTHEVRPQVHDHAAPDRAAGSNQAGRNFSGPSAEHNRPVGTVGLGAEHEARAFHHGKFGWRNFHRGFVGWAGPVFWPYAYDDLFDYAFWPYAEYGDYDDQFWAYGYDDLFGGILLPYEYAGFAAAGPVVGQQGAELIPPASAAQLCVTAGPSTAGIPSDRIAKAVQPTTEQRTKRDTLKGAEAEAVKELQSSCATQQPATPIARLDAVQARLQAMIEAVDIVRAPLADFYASLSDEQKARFDQLGESQEQAAAKQPSLTRLCGPQRDIPAFPVSQIDKAVQPDRQQRADLDALRDAANKADEIIQAACPAQLPLTPPGRLDAVRNRLQAMLHGVETVRPPLQRFYASLSDQQKARFDASSQQ
ncbi:MAG: Spy/CpxP family protein refolding chaperone [Xanthobacteraceae bacterium]